MQIKATMILHRLEWLLSKRQEITSVSEDVEKKQPSCIVIGNVNWCNLYRNLTPDLGLESYKMNLEHDTCLKVRNLLKTTENI